MQSKKQLILWVLNVLNNESDENNPITQTKIADIISDIYPCDRKTVCRNIKFLQEMGYPIKKVSKGFYMERKVFSTEEVNYIKAAIMGSTGKDETEKAALVEKVSDILGGIYRR
ncbi:MAG: hypothetical protein IKY67_05415 [Paludibacteraceae bacterium]|nr:hypothetical protein [Paludibacteraceae bacterium]